MFYKQNVLSLAFWQRVGITDRNAESLYLCGFPAFILSNGSSLALFAGGVIDANVIIEMNEKEKMI